MSQNRAPLDPVETCNLFLRRAEEISQSELLKVGAWRLSRDGDPSQGNFPSRDQLIAFLTYFRQFFLHKFEPVSVKAVAGLLKNTIQDRDLCEALATIERYDPFGLEWKHTTKGREFDLRELTEAFISKYFHSDQIPTEIGDDGYNWQVNLFSLSLVFDRGLRAVVALHAIIIEAGRRGLIPVPVSGAHSTP